MNLLLMLPIALPLGLGAWLFAHPALSPCRQHRLSLIGASGQFGAALGLLVLSLYGNTPTTEIGDWPVPFGIILAADRLSALMLTLTSALALAVIVHVSLNPHQSPHLSPSADKCGGRHFHALFQLQLFGLAGAFLTADLFNLFVFFEVLLIASYGLLIQGGGGARTRAALHYVVLNMLGSSLLLMGVALLYAVAGSLNLAQLGERLPALPPAKAQLAGVGLLLLTGAFALKAALAPVHAWLVPAYRAARAPVAALFVIMTKVGVYALLRVLALLPADTALPIPAVLATGALVTMAVGAIGVVAATDLRAMIAYLILVSVGTLLAGVATGTAEGIGAGLYYLIHTTLVTAGFFLLADVISQGRARGSWLRPAPPPPEAAWLGSLFLLGSLAIAGLPPLSGFLGKALILEALRSASQDAAGVHSSWILSWSLVLGSSLLVMLGLSRAGVMLFWQGAAASSGKAPQADNRTGARAPAAAALLAASPLLAVLAGPIAGYTEASALQLLHGEDDRSAIQALEPRDPPAVAHAQTNAETRSQTKGALP